MDGREIFLGNKQWSDHVIMAKEIISVISDLDLCLNVGLVMTRSLLFSFARSAIFWENGPSVDRLTCYLVES